MSPLHGVLGAELVRPRRPNEVGRHAPYVPTRPARLPADLADTMATSAFGRHSPPWDKVEGCTAGRESFRVYIRSGRRRGGWWVQVWSALTHTRRPP
jgi:hypothetical protein